MNREEIFSLLVMELVRRLSNDGETTVVVTNDELNELIGNSSEVGFEGSTPEQFVLQFVKFGEVIQQEVQAQDEEVVATEQETTTEASE